MAQATHMAESLYDECRDPDRSGDRARDLPHQLLRRCILMFEWFAMARNWVSFVTHVLFGLATAWAFVALAHRPGVARRAGGLRGHRPELPA